jgi:hypothetical protein
MYDARLDPQRAITGRLSKRKNGEHKADVLPGQRAEIEIDSEISSVVLFAECPKVAHNAI